MLANALVVLILAGVLALTVALYNHRSIRKWLGL